MGMPLRLRIAESKRKEIEKLRSEKGYTVYPAPLLEVLEASDFLMAEYANENNWTENDRGWLQQFDNYFQVKECLDSNSIKIDLAKSQRSYFQNIKQLIAQGKLSFKGISDSTWKRFLSGEYINKCAFIAFCYVLGKTNWQEIAEVFSKKDIIYSNLVHDYNFIVRQTQLKELLDLISNPYIPIISVEALGNFGKTTLVQEAAFRCLQARENNDDSLKLPIFDAFIFTSVKQQQYTDNKRESIQEDIFRTIAQTLKISQRIINESDSDKLLKNIIRKLKDISILLIIDNLETYEDERNINSIIEKLSLVVKPTVKILITSTRKTKPGFPLSLEFLSAEETRDFITYQAKKEGVSLTPKQYKQISDSIDRIPGSIIYTIGKLKTNICSNGVLDKLTNSVQENTQFLDQNTLKLLKENHSYAYYLLMALVMFPKPALREAIAYIVFPIPDDNTIKKDLQLLEDLLLVKHKHNRYEINLPLTRTDVFAKLKNNPDFEQQARERWINWYLQYSQEYGKKNDKDWDEYTYLDYLDAEWDNLKAAIEWCINKNKYHELLQFWRNIRSSSYDQGSSCISPFNRLPWTKKLIELINNKEYKKPEDWSILAEVSYDQAWTLTLREKFEDAEKLFREIWQLRKYQDLCFEITLAIDIIYFYWKQNKYFKAFLWIKLSKKLLNKATNLSSDFIQRQKVKILHYEGRIYYEKDDFNKARECFFEVVKLAKSPNLQRAIYLNQKWLADLDIKENVNLENAEKLLKECLYMADENIDESLIAHCKASMASLKIKKDSQDFDDAKEWAKLAYQDFERLEMFIDKEQMKFLIQSLE
ncbi:hypothetical protein BMF77_03269 [Dolichospermum sp. UHCC 0315A]|uniref:hypothetical protein n=1 Tax=Dolichospermum sp. UHCC 0315A TaxID=1914871 RepID=UPI0011E67822|nr:hypothetical protein [Dolichospermum sp. UHCC 0315A]QEI42658.1 hypothetical protein BMF77_03269 [Dolichospermum sp. UHCC 0315A]